MVIKLMGFINFGTSCIFVLRAHPVRGESHNQRNGTGEIATLLQVLKG